MDSRYKYIYIYSYVKIKIIQWMQNLNVHKNLSFKTHARRKTNFHFRFPQISSPPFFTGFSSTERNKKPFPRREIKKKKKMSKLRYTVPFEYSSNGHVNNDRRKIPWKLNEDPNNSGAAFLLPSPRNLADSFIRGFQQSGSPGTCRSALTGQVIIKREGE